jgi:hypothetical protein
MRKLIQAGFLIAFVLPAAAAAQSALDGTWKIDLKTAEFSTKPDVFLLQNGIYACSTCVPFIEVKADGQDHKVTGHPYFDSVSIKIVNDRTIEETDKKDGKIVTTSTTTVSADGTTATSEFSDSSNTNAAPITGKASATRVAAGPPGSHAISGSWKMSKMDDLSENATLLTLKVDADSVHMSDPTGQSYTAKFDGTDAPYIGDPGITTVFVKRIDRNTIEEYDKRDGKVITVARMAVSPDGKIMTLTVRDLLQGTASHFSASKQ